jgi:hypothetical protein
MKVVKGIASVGLIVAGAITGNFQMVAVGISMGASLLAPKPKAPAVSPAAADRLFASIDTRASRKIALGGSTALATDIRDQELTDGQTYLHRFITVASHKIQAVEQVWFDDKLAWTSAGGAQGDFAGYLTITPVLEGSAANAINISARMGSSRRYTGCAYLHVRYKLTGYNKKSESPFAQSIPSRVTIVGKGALVYDPRLDSTAGGSGVQRAADQTTWAWSDAAARNPALQMLWYLLGWRIKNPVTNQWKLVVGKGIPPDRIDIGSFITAANLCDELVAKAAGGTEPRYRSDGVFSESDDPSLVLDNLKAAMNAVLDDVDGKIRVTVLHNDLGSPVRTLVTADVLGEFKWAQTPPLSDTFNVIRGGYTDPSNTSLFQQVDYPEVRIASPDGIDRIQTVNLPMVQSPSQAQRLVKQRLQRQLYAGTFQATFQATAWQYLKGDVVPFTFAPLGWVNKLFRIVDIQVQLDGTVPMTLREEHPDIYLWEATDAPAVQGTAPTTYDYQLNPIYQDIQDIASNLSAYLSNETATLTADVDGNVDSYADASGEFMIFSGSTDVTADFTYATKTGGNPQGLAVTYTGRAFAVTGGLDAAEAGASLTIEATGTGPFAGVVVPKKFTIAKSLAGVDGSPAELVKLTADAQQAKYDKTNAYVGGAISFTATRQNTAAATVWTFYNAAGAAVFTGPASAFVAADPASWVSADNDHLGLTVAGVPANIAAAGGAFSIEATAGTVFDRISVVKIEDGADGLDGTAGIPGPPGPDGLTPYFHFGWADSADGSVNFTTGAQGSRVYQGVYVEYVGGADSGNYADYTWSRFTGQDGVDGSNGIPGPPGPDGLPTYAHKAYSTAADGSTGFSTTVTTGKTHLGLYIDQTLADSTNPADYAWSLIKGADGSPGAPGSPGVDALSVSASPTAITVPCTAGGTPKAALAGSQITAFKGTTNVTTTASYSFTSSGLSGAAVSSSGAVSATGISAEKGYVEVTVSSGGAGQVIRITYDKTYDGAAFVDGSSAIGAPTTTSYATVGSFSLLMGPAGTISLDTNGGFDVAAGTINVQGTIDYSLDGGGSWTTAASFSGNAAASFGSGDWAADTSLSGTTIGLTTKQTVMFRVTMRKTNTNSFTSFGGSMYASWSG